MTDPSALRVLVTGASGFVGAALVSRLAADETVTVRAGSRQLLGTLPSVERVLAPQLGPDSDWRESLRGVDVVVHAAARVHVMRERSADPLREYRRANVEGTVALAKQAALAGVRRLVFMSSIKVNGELTRRGAPFRADDVPQPSDPYAVSKHEAETELRSIAAQSEMEVVIIRPVLVYGAGVKGNFYSMIRLVRAGIPLPLGLLENRRSLVALDNLVDLLAICIRHPAAANQTFMVSDGNDISTAELVRHLAEAMERPDRLLRVPRAMLVALGALVGKSALVDRLCSDLQVDIEPTKALLGWAPRVRMADALRATVTACE